MRDWTPAVGYASSIAVPAASTIYITLYPIPDFFVGDAEFLIEDEEESHLYLERIIGDIHMAFAANATAGIAWQLMPLGIDYETLAVLEPYDTDWSYNSTEWANCKFWDRRSYLLETTSAAASVIDHPYWSQVDTHPRFGLGSKKNLWPVLAVQNFHPAVDARVVHHLRLFWK